ncbi:hypothetical protein BCR42DRAFT_337868 [Absidia repens]|uniref:F-box domain-containing protein n=1 Tax=Absidia repens TaxID=90262 RepID=A0A1X2HZ41_9FUNG|nr:hypothetical protein BCR42DRAFT_337868 [Absidia repens]
MEAIGHCPLQQLTLVCCNELDYNMFASLTRCSSTLTSLDIRNCALRWLDTPDTAQQAVANLMVLHHLTSFEIYSYEHDYAPFITALFVDVPSMTPWPELTVFEVYPCHDVTDTMAIALLQTQPKLTNVSFCYSHITDNTLDAIVTYVPEIVELNVMGNPGITPDGLRRLVKTCRKLETVHCSYCRICPEDFPELDESKMIVEADCIEDENPYQVCSLMGEAYVADVDSDSDSDYDSC